MCCLELYCAPVSFLSKQLCFIHSSFTHLWACVYSTYTMFPYRWLARVWLPPVSLFTVLTTPEPEWADLCGGTAGPTGSGWTAVGLGASAHWRTRHRSWRARTAGTLAWPGGSGWPEHPAGRRKWGGQPGRSSLHFHQQWPVLFLSTFIPLSHILFPFSIFSILFLDRFPVRTAIVQVKKTPINKSNSTI